AFRAAFADVATTLEEWTKKLLEDLEEVKEEPPQVPKSGLPAAPKGGKSEPAPSVTPPSKQVKGQAGPRVVKVSFVLPSKVESKRESFLDYVSARAKDRQKGLPDPKQAPTHVAELRLPSLPTATPTPAVKATHLASSVTKTSEHPPVRVRSKESW